jgi:hypothetical protein
MPPMFAAEVNTSDIAAVVVAVASVAVVLLLVFVVVSINRTLTTMRLSIEQIRRETLPVVDELRRTVTTANAELQRLDGLIDSASSVTATVDSASHLAYLAFSNPLIKLIALAAGTSRAAKALRRG